MNSIKFPEMFNQRQTKVVEGRDATIQDVLLLLKSEKGGFKFDPYFGIRLKRYTFNQNNYVLRDILIDEIFTQIKTFCPQIIINREDITINQTNNKLVATIKCINKIDFTTDMYQLELFNDEER